MSIPSLFIKYVFMEMHRRNSVDSSTIVLRRLRETNAATYLSLIIIRRLGSIFFCISFTHWQNARVPRARENVKFFPSYPILYIRDRQRKALTLSIMYIR